MIHPYTYFSIVEIVASSPPGMVITSPRHHGGIYYSNVTWYPSQYQVGQQSFCFKAVDSAGWDPFFVLNIVKVHLTETLVSEPAQLRTYGHLTPYTGNSLLTKPIPALKEANYYLRTPRLSASHCWPLLKLEGASNWHINYCKGWGVLKYRQFLISFHSLIMAWRFLHRNVRTNYICHSLILTCFCVSNCR